MPKAAVLTYAATTHTPLEDVRRWIRFCKHRLQRVIGRLCATQSDSPLCDFWLGRRCLDMTGVSRWRTEKARHSCTTDLSQTSKRTKCVWHYETSIVLATQCKGRDETVKESHFYTQSGSQTKHARRRHFILLAVPLQYVAIEMLGPIQKEPSGKPYMINVMAC